MEIYIRDTTKANTPKQIALLSKLGALLKDGKITLMGRADSKILGNPSNFWDIIYRLEDKGVLEIVRGHKRFKNPSRKRDVWLSRYGITTIQYNEMLASQNGKCAICRQEQTKKLMSVDHCHGTGRVRGLLCHNCNVSLGLFKDDPTRLFRAYKYLLAVEDSKEFKSNYITNE